MALADEGFTVAVAENGAAALRIVDTFRPHLIFLDMFMPGMDGKSFLQAYRARFPPTPIVALSASSNVGTQARELGLDDSLKNHSILTIYFRFFTSTCYRKLSNYV